jgi:glycosyltransferase involved in cell wall biosynthesis
MKIISIWDSRFASEYNFEFKLVELNHSLVTFAQSYEKFDNEPLLLQNWMHSIEPPNYLRKFFSSPNKISSYVLGRNYYRAIKRHVKKNKPDVIICNFGQIGIEFVKFCKRNQIPLIVLFYGHDISAAIKSKRWQRKYRIYRDMPGTLIVLCEEARRRLVNLGCEPDDIEIWNLPIVFDFPEATNIKSNRIRLITAGRFIEKKGYPILFEALNKLKKKDIKFEIEIFGYGSNLSEIQALSNRYDLEGNIIWRVGLGGSAFKVEFYKALDDSDIFLLCAVPAANGDDEGGPSLSLVMAQAKGIPVITTNFPGHEISVLHGVSGFICEGDISEEMANYISSYADSYAEYRKIGKAGAINARNEFDFANQVEKFEKILETTIEKLEV